MAHKHNSSVNAVLIIPTGLGCTIGGHAGDAGAVAKLLASCCDTLITHPNVLNASDINEMPDNCWYVDGFLLDRFLLGGVWLAPPKQNRILLVVNKPVLPQTINSVNAARHTLGATIEIMELDTPLVMNADFNPDGSAGGTTSGLEDLIKQAGRHDYDAVAVQSVINVPKDVAIAYLQNGGVNPWGGIEAFVSRHLSCILACPVAHAPMDSGVFDDFNEVVPSRMAAELVSVSYLHCVLKGLHDAPRATRWDKQGGLNVRDIDVMVSPFRCWGAPHEACLKSGVDIIAVRENYPSVTSEAWAKASPGVVVQNYLEAAGYLMAKRARVSTESVRSTTF